MHHKLPSRKALEVSFRRWISGESPSKYLISHLSVKDKEIYRFHLGDETKGEIDHILPLSFFDLSKPDEIKLAWSLDNLRRISLGENKTKGGSIIEGYLTLLSSKTVNEKEKELLLERAKKEFEKQFPRINISI